jgi:CheY-like chemotaxis protein
LYLTITNTGPEIDEEFLKEIFEPFKTKGKRNGTGLGLAIAKNVLVAHEGDLTVHTNIDGNVSFRLELPITKEAMYDKLIELQAHGSKETKAFLPDEETEKAADIPMNYHRESHKLGTILVIDDDSIWRDAVRSMIEKDEEFQNFEVIEAADGEEVLDLIEKHGVGYIVSDFQLGKHRLNGMEVLEKVKAHKKEVRVLLMSSNRTSDQSFEALEKGAVNFIVKPVCRGDILSLTKLYGGYRKE